MIKETPETTDSVVEHERVDGSVLEPLGSVTDEQLVVMSVDRARS